MLKLLLTCEHGGNQVPAAYASYFSGQETLLATHRGYDIGALDLFKYLQPLAVESFYSETSRLLVELNRSLHHPNLFSAITKKISGSEKQAIIQSYYLPYRNRVEQQIATCLAAGNQLVHLAVHTFTPVLDDEVRKAAIGLLYDPKRKYERMFCREWKQKLSQQEPSLRVRFNYPYLGTADGFPTYLRRKFTEEQYIGIELEVNQKYPLAGGEKWQELKEQIRQSLQQVLRSAAHNWKLEIMN
jgi:predicted N-formylglutamate amidohydrolase